MSLPKPRILGSALGSRAPEFSEVILHFFYREGFRCLLSQKAHRTWMRRLLDKQRILDKNGTGEIPCGDGDCSQGEFKAEAL